jgi:hypothetical protein
MFLRGCKLIFLVVFEELLDLVMWLTLPKSYRVGCQNMCLNYLKNLGFSFQNYYFLFVHMVLHNIVFNMTTVSRINIEVLGFFNELCKF